MTDLSPLYPKRLRVALLVDGENLSASRAKAILDLAEGKGEVLIRRVYGKLADLQAKGWSHAPGFRPIPATSSKNSADLLLSVDAMELALDGRADCIIIAASDNDYCHVALKLRERGFPVHGLIDSASKCDDLRACYASVTDLMPPDGRDVPAVPPPSVAPKTTQPAPPPATKIPKLVAAFLKANADPKGFPIVSLNAPMRAQFQIKISDTPQKTWRAFLLAHNAQFDCDPKGPNARVRLRV